MNVKKYYKKLDILRIFACISVLLYHLNILKGGYLAVCIFFVLSGYLVCMNSFNKEKFSLKKYYISRFKRLYLPLLIVVFITVFFTSLNKNIVWLNLKSEVKSIILGYNNYFQILTNSNYFTKNSTTPFIHLWYVEILIQFDLVFPIIFLILKKIGDNIKKCIPCIILLIASLIGTIYFINISEKGNLMLSYYGTFARIYEILYGVTLAFISYYYKDNFKKIFKYHNIIYIFYLMVLLFLFIIINSKNIYYNLIMVLISLITIRIIEYVDESDENRYIKIFSSITYEIYLIQYPVIFLLENYNIYIKLILILILSIIFHFMLNNKSENLFLRVIRYLLIIVTIGFVLNGINIFYLEKDHTKEMNNLKKELSINKKTIQDKQDEYLKNTIKKQKELSNDMDDLKNKLNNIDNYVSNVSVVGIGDSVMLGAVNNLYDKFHMGYFDAQISRGPQAVIPILTDLKNKNALGDIVIINIGANGKCSDSIKEQITNIASDSYIFFVTVTNDYMVHANDDLKYFASTKSNVDIIDWNSISNNHEEYFYADKIHLTPSGRIAYTDAIYNKISEYYKGRINNKIIELNNQIQSVKNNISFFGNDILVNIYSKIKDNYKNSSFVEVFNYKELKDNINKQIKDNTINNKVVLIFDKNMKLTKKQYNDIVKMLKDKEVYILNKDIKNTKNLKFIIKKEYLMADKIHLNDKGNKELIRYIKEVIDCSI